MKQHLNSQKVLMADHRAVPPGSLDGKNKDVLQLLIQPEPVWGQ